MSGGGQDVITRAEELVVTLIEVHQMVRAARRDEPGAFPGYSIGPGVGPLARRILGELLDTGWTMPDADIADGAP